MPYTEAVHKLRLPTRLALASACAASFLLLGATPSLAERMESGSYVIQFGNFNMTSGEKNSASYNLTDTVGQTGAGPYGHLGSSGYFVGGGFQYIYPFDVFSFTISKLHIDFGVLTPGVFSTDSHTLTVSAKRPGYTVYAYESHPLQHEIESAETIPNTTCDSGTCTITSAGIWQTAGNDGFGYNMSGHDIPADFLNNSYFRPFADNSLGQPMQVVMGSGSNLDSRQATVTYQVSQSGSQAGGKYSTSIVYIALPSY